MKRIRVVNNKTRRSMVVAFAKGKICLFIYGWDEPTIFTGTEEEFVNDWSNPDFYEDGDNEIFDV